MGHSLATCGDDPAGVTGTAGVAPPAALAFKDCMDTRTPLDAFPVMDRAVTDIVKNVGVLKTWFIEFSN
jgi:hypothetical protein